MSGGIVSDDVVSGGFVVGVVSGGIVNEDDLESIIALFISVEFISDLIGSVVLITDLDNF